MVNPLDNASIAIAHEWLDSRAGSEKTFELIAKAFPSADIYALTAEPGIPWQLDGREVRTSFLDKRPFRGRRAGTLAMMPLAWRTMTRNSYDVVITSSHACAKGFWPGRAALHLSYCHTPMRYVWLPDIDRRSRWIPRVAVNALRHWDLHSADWVDHFAANSSVTAERIRKIYGRTARIICPPVDTEFFSPPPYTPSRDYLFAFSRMVPYKRLDLAIEAAGRLGKKLVVAGRGPDERHLRQIADQRAHGLVSFVISPSAEDLRDLYRHASAFIFPALEDFGIVPVEAQACGTPVIALDAGGSRDTVINGVTGILAAEQSVEAFSDAIVSVDTQVFEAEKCITHARSFSQDVFLEKLYDWVGEALEGSEAVGESHSA